MRVGYSIDQLPRNADPLTSPAHRAFEHVSDAEFLTDLLRIDHLAFVGEARVAGDDEQPADARERGDDLLDHAVGEIFLLRIAAQILERQYRDRRLVGQRERRKSHRLGGAEPDPPHMHRPSNVLQRLFAQILEGEVELVAHLITHHPADADPARLGQRFQPRRDIDAVAINIVVVEDDVAEIDPDAELDAPRLPDLGVALGHPLLQLDRTAHRVDDAGKLDQQPVAGGLDDTPPMLFDLGIRDLTADRLQRGERPFLVRPHQPRIAGDIGGKDRGETAGLAHPSGKPALRRPSTYSARRSWGHRTAAPYWLILAIV